jgi:hypothetical protein
MSDEELIDEAHRCAEALREGKDIDTKYFLVLKSEIVSRVNTERRKDA